MNLIDMNQKSKESAKKAVESHDGIAAKYANILLCACEAKSVEDVVRQLSWSSDTIKNTLKQYQKKGDSLFRPRPRRKKSMINNFLITTWEGAEWEYYKGALLHSGLAVNQLVFDKIRNLLPNPSGKKILEIGPGEGAMAMMLSDAGYMVECVDIGDFELVNPQIKLKLLDVDKGLEKSVGGGTT